MIESKQKLGKTGILGDSYSTFENVIPKGYATYYGKERDNGSGVEKREQTWWGYLEEKTDAKIVLNSSYSGSTICNTGYGGNYCIATSFITRAKDFFEPERKELDTLLVFGGTNDSWAGAPIGELKYENRTAEDLKSVLPAVCELAEYLTGKLKSGTKVIFLIGTEVKPQIADGIIAACGHYGTEYIRLKNTDLKNGHPTATGMEQIAVDVIDYFDKKE